VQRTSSCPLWAKSGNSGLAEPLSGKTLDVGARQGGISSRGGKDAGRVDFVRHFAVRIVRIFPHVHHHRGDRLAYSADIDECARALLASFNVLFSGYVHTIKDTGQVAIGRPLAVAQAGKFE
jgi:hypothetical protein